MKRLGSGVVIVAVVVLLSSLVAVWAISRQDLRPHSHETPPNNTVINEPVIDEPVIDETTDGCSPIPPTPTPTVSTNRPTLAPASESPALAAQATYEHHARGQVISIHVEVEGTP